MLCLVTGVSGAGKSSLIQDTLYPALPVFAQNWACTAGGYLRFRSRFNAHFHSVLAAWKETTWADADTLRHVQRQRLGELVARARETVPYYRDLETPSGNGDPAEAIRETLASIPPLEKRAYRDQPWAFISRDVPRMRLHSGQTSGMRVSSRSELPSEPHQGQ